MKTTFSFAPYGTFTSMKKNLKTFICIGSWSTAWTGWWPSPFGHCWPPVSGRGGMMAVLAAGLLEAMDRERHQGGPIRVQQLAVSTYFFCWFSLFFMVYEIQIFPRWVALMRGGRIWVIQSGRLLPPTGWRSSGRWRPRRPWP
jgi:hypothetical protein